MTSESVKAPQLIKYEIFMKWEKALQEKGIVFFPNEARISKAVHDKLTSLMVAKKITMDIKKGEWGIYSITVRKSEAPQL